VEAFADIGFKYLAHEMSAGTAASFHSFLADLLWSTASDAQGVAI
jgi:hypothetical protein